MIRPGKNQRLLDVLVSIADAEVGTVESGGNNRGPAILQYQEATWLAPGPWPWCAAFICWAMRAWLREAEVRAALDLRTPADAEAWRPRGAGAFWFTSWARGKGLTVLPESALAKRGDLVVFDFSHIGIVRIDETATGRFIETIEGNTNGRGDRDSTSGDGVWRKTRHRSLTQHYIRLLPS
jgi:hypothetical protein